jgi:hypothetical protein
MPPPQERCCPHVVETSASWHVKPGDIIGFSGDSWLSGFINLMTYGIPFWSISHVGIVGLNICEEPSEDIQGNGYGGLLVYESTMQSEVPCSIQKKLVSGVQAHPLQDTIDAYRGKVWHYPLSERLSLLDALRLSRFLNGHIGREYDEIGALRAGGFGFSWIESMLRKEDLSSLFCSELCAAAHNEVGLMNGAHAGRWNPNLFVRRQRRRGVLSKPRRYK